MAIDAGEVLASPSSHLRRQDGEAIRQYYVAVDRLQFKMETLVDLLDVIGRRSSLPSSKRLILLSEPSERRQPPPPHRRQLPPPAVDPCRFSARGLSSRSSSPPTSYRLHCRPSHSSTAAAHLTSLPGASPSPSPVAHLHSRCSSHVRSKPLFLSLVPPVSRS
ncbi:hypothetical protein EJ110_NYTH56530 [Nymphaea thermarum]|nr:hypothetical protein EJ110_NYTH56530 [Nymphaea thermarum]